MYHTIVLSSCVSVQGECVEMFANGEVAIRDGEKTYRGRPIGEVRLPEHRAPTHVRFAPPTP